MLALLSEDDLRSAVDLLVRLVESAGALVIFAGAVVAFVQYVVTAVKDRTTAGFPRVRLRLGRALALGLEFQLAADILRTAVAPTFTEIGQLAAVAGIRTALNFFLEREIRSELAAERGEGEGSPAAGGLEPTVAGPRGGGGGAGGGADDGEAALGPQA